MIKIPLSNPDITDIEREYVLSVLNTPNLSLGPFLGKFEEAFSKYIGSKYAIAVNSGTSGLHLAIKSLGIKEGDKVITTPFSFIASANCILFERAKPVFIDIDPCTLNIDPDKIEKYLRNCKPKEMPKAILPVHVFGYPCNMDALTEIANKYGLHIIEDACEAIGAEYKGRKVGTFGKVSVFAFYPNKQITTGEGGMIVTDDEDIAELCRSFRNQGRGKNSKWLQHDRLGYNYRISDINCALGLAQIERIEDILKKRANVAKLYNEKLKEIEEIILPPDSNDNIKISWFVYVICLSDKFTIKDRNNILNGLKSAGIGCNNYFSPIHLQPFYKNLFGFKKGDFPITEHVSQRSIALPFYNNLKEDQIDYVVKILKSLLVKI